MKCVEISKSEYSVEKQRYGVSLLKEHYRYLYEISEARFNNDKTVTIFFLIKKYIRYLHRISIMEIKQNFTATYQPVCKEYRRYSIVIDPLLWSELQDLRKKSGYSISFLLRIMIEWEMVDEGLLEKPLLEKPIDEDKEENAESESLNFQFYAGNISSLPVKSYVWCVVVHYHTRKVRTVFVNEFS